MDNTFSISYGKTLTSRIIFLHTVVLPEFVPPTIPIIYGFLEAPFEVTETPERIFELFKLGMLNINF